MTPKQPYAGAHSALTITALSVLSSLSGLLLEMVLAWRFGASGIVDAFRVSLLLVMVGSQLFLGYLLPQVIVPLYSEYRAKGLAHEGGRVAFSLAMVLSLLMLPFILWIWIDPEALIGKLGPGLTGEGRDAASLLVRFYSLTLLLMIWSGVISGILYVYRVFWLSAAAQLLPNTLVILAIGLLGGEMPVKALAAGVLLGYMVMLVLFGYVLGRIGDDFSLHSCLGFGPGAGVRKAVLLTLPLLITVLVGQWGIIIINRVLTEMTPGTLAEFGYAWKLLTLVNLLPAGLATVLFPAFSDAHSNNNSLEFSRLLMRFYRVTLLLTIPVAVVLFVESAPIVDLLFGRGGMGIEAVTETLQLFSILLIAGSAGTLSGVLSKVAFAMQDTRSPTIIMLFSALVITILVPYSAEVGGAKGVAWAYAAISLLGALLMLAYLILRYKALPARETFLYFCGLSLFCIGIALAAVLVRTLFLHYAPRGSGFEVLEIVVVGLVSMGVGYLLYRPLGIYEVIEVMQYFKFKLARISGKVR